MTPHDQHTSAEELTAGSLSVIGAVERRRERVRHEARVLTSPSGEGRNGETRVEAEANLAEEASLTLSLLKLECVVADLRRARTVERQGEGLEAVDVWQPGNRATREMVRLERQAHELDPTAWALFDNEAEANEARYRRERARAKAAAEWALPVARNAARHPTPNSADGAENGR